jgi:hypothetical protein
MVIDEIQGYIEQLQAMRDRLEQIAENEALTPAIEAEIVFASDYARDASVRLREAEKRLREWRPKVLLIGCN